MNFSIEKNGPTIPNVPNQKFFNSIKFAAMGGSNKFKAGDVVKMTQGKIRLRNESEKNFTDGNSKFAEKGDIITVTGPVYAENQSRDDHAAARVFAGGKK